MKKDEIIKIITTCAKEYKKNLENKNLFFIFEYKQRVGYFETVFLPRNFLHLTGIEINGSIKSTDFYELCLRNQLSPSAFETTPNGTTDMKLSILPQLMKIHKTAKMIGEYDFSKSFLVTEKIAGNVTACLGFIRDGDYYIPNTALKEDIRNITAKPQQRVIAIFRKDKEEVKYSLLCYTAKGVQFENLRLPNEISEKIDFNNITFGFPASNTSQLLTETHKASMSELLSAHEEAAATSNAPTSIALRIKKAKDIQMQKQPRTQARDKAPDHRLEG